MRRNKVGIADSDSLFNQSTKRISCGRKKRSRENKKRELERKNIANSQRSAASERFATSENFSPFRCFLAGLTWILTILRFTRKNRVSTEFGTNPKSVPKLIKVKPAAANKPIPSVGNTSSHDDVSQATPRTYRNGRERRKQNSIPKLDSGNSQPSSLSRCSTPQDKPERALNRTPDSPAKPGQENNKEVKINTPSCDDVKSTTSVRPKSIQKKKKQRDDCRSPYLVHPTEMIRAKPQTVRTALKEKILNKVVESPSPRSAPVSTIKNNGQSETTKKSEDSKQLSSENPVNPGNNPDDSQGKTSSPVKDSPTSEPLSLNSEQDEPVKKDGDDKELTEETPARPESRFFHYQPKLLGQISTFRFKRKDGTDGHVGCGDPATQWVFGPKKPSPPSVFLSINFKDLGTVKRDGGQSSIWSQSGTTGSTPRLVNDYTPDVTKSPQSKKNLADAFRFPFRVPSSPEARSSYFQRKIFGSAIENPPPPTPSVSFSFGQAFETQPTPRESLIDCQRKNFGYWNETPPPSARSFSEDQQEIGYREGIDRTVLTKPDPGLDYELTNFQQYESESNVSSPECHVRFFNDGVEVFLERTPPRSGRRRRNTSPPARDSPKIEEIGDGEKIPTKAESRPESKLTDLQESSSESEVETHVRFFNDGVEVFLDKTPPRSRRRRRKTSAFANDSQTFGSSRMAQYAAVKEIGGVDRIPSKTYFGLESKLTDLQGKNSESDRESPISDSHFFDEKSGESKKIDDVKQSRGQAKPENILGDLQEKTSASADDSQTFHSSKMEQDAAVKEIGDGDKMPSELPSEEKTTGDNTTDSAEYKPEHSDMQEKTSVTVAKPSTSSPISLNRDQQESSKEVEDVKSLPSEAESRPESKLTDLQESSSESEVETHVRFFNDGVEVFLDKTPPTSRRRRRKTPAFANDSQTVGSSRMAQYAAVKDIGDVDRIPSKTESGLESKLTDLLERNSESDRESPISDSLFFDEKPEESKKIDDVKQSRGQTKSENILGDLQEKTSASADDSQTFDSFKMEQDAAVEKLGDGDKMPSELPAETKTTSDNTTDSVEYKPEHSDLQEKTSVTVAKPSTSSPISLNREQQESSKEVEDVKSLPSEAESRPESKLTDLQESSSESEVETHVRFFNDGVEVFLDKTPPTSRRRRRKTPAFANDSQTFGSSRMAQYAAVEDIGDVDRIPSKTESGLESKLTDLLERNSESDRESPISDSLFFDEKPEESKKIDDVKQSRGQTKSENILGDLREKTSASADDSQTFDSFKMKQDVAVEKLGDGDKMPSELPAEKKTTSDNTTDSVEYKPEHSDLQEKTSVTVAKPSTSSPISLNREQQESSKEVEDVKSLPSEAESRPESKLTDLQESSSESEVETHVRFFNDGVEVFLEDTPPRSRRRRRKTSSSANDSQTFDSSRMAQYKAVKEIGDDDKIPSKLPSEEKTTSDNTTDSAEYKPEHSDLQEKTSVTVAKPSTSPISLNREKQESSKEVEDVKSLQSETLIQLQCKLDDVEKKVSVSETKYPSIIAMQDQRVGNDSKFIFRNKRLAKLKEPFNPDIRRPDDAQMIDRKMKKVHRKHFSSNLCGIAEGEEPLEENHGDGSGTRVINREKEQRSLPIEAFRMEGTNFSSKLRDIVEVDELDEGCDEADNIELIQKTINRQRISPGKEPMGENSVETLDNEVEKELNLPVTSQKEENSTTLEREIPNELFEKEEIEEKIDKGEFGNTFETLNGEIPQCSSGKQWGDGKDLDEEGRKSVQVLVIHGDSESCESVSSSELLSEEEIRYYANRGEFEFDNTEENSTTTLEREIPNKLFEEEEIEEKIDKESGNSDATSRNKVAVAEIPQCSSGKQWGDGKDLDEEGRKSVQVLVIHGDSDRCESVSSSELLSEEEIRYYANRGEFELDNAEENSTTLDREIPNKLFEEEEIEEKIDKESGDSDARQDKAAKQTDSPAKKRKGKLKGVLKALRRIVPHQDNEKHQIPGKNDKMAKKGRMDGDNSVETSDNKVEKELDSPVKSREGEFANTLESLNGEIPQCSSGKQWGDGKDLNEEEGRKSVQVLVIHGDSEHCESVSSSELLSEEEIRYYANRGEFEFDNAKENLTTLDKEIPNKLFEEEEIEEKIDKGKFKGVLKALRRIIPHKRNEKNPIPGKNDKMAKKDRMNDNDSSSGEEIIFLTEPSSTKVSRVKKFFRALRRRF
ncbi:uncharacterized protein LOC120341303 isoform X3 [Styela clava]